MGDFKEVCITFMQAQTTVVRNDKKHQEDVLVGYLVAAKTDSCLEQNFIKSILNVCFVSLIVLSL